MLGNWRPVARKIASALLVDDDTAFRCALQASLRRRGVRAHTAASVEEGYHLLEDETVDLVAVDFRMPGLPMMNMFGFDTSPSRWASNASKQNGAPPAR